MVTQSNSAHRIDRDQKSDARTGADLKPLMTLDSQRMRSLMATAHARPFSISEDWSEKCYDEATQLGRTTSNHIDARTEIGIFVTVDVPPRHST
jgi:hypothetical protein